MFLHCGSPLSLSDRRDMNKQTSSWWWREKTEAAGNCSDFFCQHICKKKSHSLPILSSFGALYKWIYLNHNYKRNSQSVTITSKTNKRLQRPKAGSIKPSYQMQMCTERKPFCTNLSELLFVLLISGWLKHKVETRTLVLHVAKNLQQILLSPHLALFLFVHHIKVSWRREIECCGSGTIY